MATDQQSEVAQILELQVRIADRLTKLGFVKDSEASGNITHHLAEATVFGAKLAAEIMPALLSLPLDKKKEIGELVVDLQYELSELRESLENMEPALVKLMNFLTE
jgi:hypothetical protein